MDIRLVCKGQNYTIPPRPRETKAQTENGTGGATHGTD